MNNFIVRTAKTGDIEVLLEFEQEIIKAERPFDPTLGDDPITYYDLDQLIRSDDAQVMVVSYNSTIIASGYAQVKRARHYLNHELYAYLGFMYTHPDFRGRGVNKLILNALREWSGSKGLKEIRLTVYDENFSAIRAYEKAGFKKHIIEMRMPSDD
ncbi:GNAT family N-acetyltransferase [Costertonia aggregata]|uniref:GNAT family N-acetyltransferase n=1 Tax=Costertonia aggregata TaxID=343403 RepID=A0A7H9ALR7_9FLAO|nr:GNAT family N-acetyltransferase [Costertonia aggregata]QLG44314.1 GNAT family N-acetyltransferase [Costertonia aggregata]